ncbi:MAG: pitrilysin family protein [Candidatus Palauibacterales bacterium]|nr:pitrilysin family protein [Candidatus Palauibacterales bacterium]MDP2528219.1 pitrilysin family protein [Candidatus Palauibacterales bacterium]MDP2584879.1 pitrilysin family protein [Candidatus Palauibacterales bacterium]
MTGTGEAGARGAPAGSVDRSGAPSAGPLRPLTLPELRRFEFTNGLRLIVAEDHQLPEVSLRLVLEAGATAEPRGQEGVAELTGRLLTEGAAGRSAGEVASWLDRLGAGFSVSAGYDVSILSLHTLSDVLEGALDFLAAVARHPSFEPAEVERVRGERLDEIDRDLDRPEVVADSALIRAVYGGHRYGTPAAGDRPTVERLGREQVAAFHRRRYGPSGAALVACGAVDAAALRDAVEARFGDWTGGEAFPSDGAPGAIGAPVPGSVLLVDRPSSAQAEIRLGTVGAAYADAAFFELLVGNAILGGLFNSRVNMNLREERGWTYGARTSFHFRREAGPFVGQTAVETGVAAEALSEFLRETAQLLEEAPGEDEMELARNSLVLSLPRQFETASQVSSKLVTQVVYDLPNDYWARYRARIEAVTASGVLEALRGHLDPAEMAQVVVGDAGALEGDLEGRFGDVDVRAGAGRA